MAGRGRRLVRIYRIQTDAPAGIEVVSAVPSSIALRLWPRGSVPAAAGCASTTLPLTASDRTPAAKGTVKTSTDDQGNTKLTVNVDYLPKPGDLAPNLTTFVVWSVADDGACVRNLGQLTIDGDRHGSVALVSPLTRFRLLLTAEENGTGEKPSAYTILEGMIEPKS